MVHLLDRQDLELNVYVQWFSRIDNTICDDALCPDLLSLLNNLLTLNNVLLFYGRQGIMERSGLRYSLLFHATAFMLDHVLYFTVEKEFTLCLLWWDQHHAAVCTVSRLS